MPDTDINNGTRLVILQRRLQLTYKRVEYDLTFVMLFTITLTQIFST